jgi:hypothetical protein
MKETGYIYKIVERYNVPQDTLEETLNTVNTDKLLANVIELEYAFIIVWEK